MGRPPKLRTGPNPPPLPVAPEPSVPEPSAPEPPPISAALAGVPAMLEFRPLGHAELWRVEKFEDLAVEFNLIGESPEDCRARLITFANFAERHARLWLLVRRLYGVAPLIPGLGVTLDDLRVWSRAELEAAGWEIKADLEGLRIFWTGYDTQDRRKAEASLAAPPTSAGPAPAAPPAEGLPLDDQVLEYHHFSERLFRLTVFDPVGADGKGCDAPRSDRENRVERDWFVSRVSAWTRMLSDAMGGPIARTALLNDLYLRRLETEIAVATPKARLALYDQKSTLAKEYDHAIQRLQEMFPEMAVAGRVSFRALLSDVVVAWRDYRAHGSWQLVDKIVTSAEMEWLITASQQVEPRYRLGQQTAILEAINGLTNPDFRSQFKPKILAGLDRMAKASLSAARELLDEPLVDLEDGVLPGEGSDFEDFADAECPHCGAPISSSALRCAECRKSVVPAARLVTPAAA